MSYVYYKNVTACYELPNKFQADVFRHPKHIFYNSQTRFFIIITSKLYELSKQAG